jgi:hypothetical protein
MADESRWVRTELLASREEVRLLLLKYIETLSTDDEIHAITQLLREMANFRAL